MSTKTRLLKGLLVFLWAGWAVGAYNNYNSNKNSNKGARDFTVCDGAVVKVTRLYVTCDSPYTFYYGNGASRNLPVCNYGDKISIDTRFKVVDDIQQGDTIFVTMAVYDDQGNLLTANQPVYLCKDLVGYDCTVAGYYSFSTRMRLPYPYDTSSASASQFLPDVHMAFSTKADSGYNLGGLNVECQRNDPNSVTWTRPKRTPVEAFVLDFGLLVFSGIILTILAVFLWRRSSEYVRNKVEGSSSFDESGEFVGFD